jgi:serine/threonine protein kinase
MQTDVEKSMSSDQNASAEVTYRVEEPPDVGISEGSIEQLRKMSLWNSISKQERDYVTAALILRGRHLTERALRNGIKGWTTFGAVPLGEALTQRGLIDPDVMARIEEEAEQYFETLNLSASWKYMPRSVSRRTSSLLERLDPSGHVAKIFGLSRLPRAVVGNEFRVSQTHFKLIRKLGQGGLGTVWLAIDSNLNRYVAVKEILGHPDRHSAAVARFRREAEITGRLDHPGIVPVHVLAEDEAGERLFYVMRFLGNETLEDAIREYHERREARQTQPMDFHRLLTAFVSICQAIAYAHAHKVVHRDLKPQNVALDSFGQVIVLDWGLAKSLDMDDPQVFSAASLQKPPDNLDVTVAGQVTGTPMYMAPEQAAGRVDEIDERTDVYGLGAILFCILTGYAPHELSQESLAAGAGMAHLLDLIVDGPASSPRKLNPSVPPALEAICQKAMASDRYARYQSAAALADDVQRWMADEPISILRESLGKRFRRWSAAHHTLSRLIGIVAATVLMMAAAAAFSSYQYAVVGAQMRREQAGQEIDELRDKLSFEIQTLTEHARFLSKLPAIQGVLDRQSKPGAPGDSGSTERLKQTFRRLIETKSSYLAISSWVKFADNERINLRVERGDVGEDELRVDFTEFFGRHLPAISQLADRQIYLGMPGRLSKDLASHTDEARKLLAESKEGVGNNLVAGAAIFAPATNERLGGILIECDLEKLLREHLFTASPETTEIDLTDSSGHSVMRFTREKGLFPVDPASVDRAELATTRPFFTTQTSSDVFVASPVLTAAKVPLNQHESGQYMGLVVRFRSTGKPNAN